MPRALRNGRASVAVALAPVRCAVYCRKSTTEGLDSDFSSIDNQREAGESFIASQRHEGWSALTTRYDDGGFSGGTVERPALKRLLADVDAGLIDTIVVYKLDRLSRSLVDFGRIHEFLEKCGVALVSVTESINTKSPHGRMMVNVLLSFAQYERELVGERTRDKMSAARRRGKWTGGMPPLGYDVVAEGGKLVVNREEAEQVKAIFQLYVENPSLVGLSQELNRRGWRRKSWTTKDGKCREGKPWDKENLRHVLVNPLYAGKQKLGDETFPGEHPAIISKAVFRQVQRLLNENRLTTGSGHRNRHGALLRGILRCSACDSAMTHAWTRAHGKLYRYYVCQRAQKQGWDACPTKSVKADDIETFVVDRIRCIGRDPGLREATFREALAQLAAERRGLKAEAKRLEREAEASRRDVERLVGTLSRSSGAAADAVQVEVGKAQERLGTLDARLAEVRSRDAALDAQRIDEAELARALEAFDPLWEVLLSPEKERVLRLLIEGVTYNGATGELEIKFGLAGIATLAAETAEAVP